jgi:integral membrane protein
VRNLFTAYRVLALVVGVLLAALAVGMVLKYGLTEGTELQAFGADLTATVALLHGWIYIVYVVVAFLLSRRAGWSLQFLLLMLLAGLVPFLIFWVEHRVVSRLRAEHAELRRAPA